MDHSEILRKTEEAIRRPLKVVDVLRVGTITHTDAKDTFRGGECLPTGEYGIIELRILVPLADVQ